MSLENGNGCRTFQVQTLFIKLYDDYLTWDAGIINKRKFRLRYDEILSVSYSDGGFEGAWIEINTAGQAYRYVSPIAGRENIGVIVDEIEKRRDKVRSSAAAVSANNIDVPKTYTQNININPNNIEPTITRVEMFLEDREWDKATAYCETALDYFPTDYRLYKYLLLSDLKCQTINDLRTIKSSFTANAYYKKMVRYADDSFKKEIDGILEDNRKEQIYQRACSLDGVYAIDQFMRIEGYKDANARAASIKRRMEAEAKREEEKKKKEKQKQEEEKQSKYLAAKELQAKANDLEGFKKALDAFEELMILVNNDFDPRHDDVGKRYNEIREKYNELKVEKEYTDAVELLASGELSKVKVAKDTFDKLTNQNDYKDCRKKAEEAQAIIDAEKKRRNKKEKIIVIAALICATGLFLFSVVTKTIIPNNNYNKAVQLMEEEDYEEALKVFTALGDYKDSKDKATECQNGIDYKAALESMEKEDYEGALKVFTALGDYKDSKDKATECQNNMDDADYKTALELMEKRDYEKALEAFTALGDYKDSKEKVVECQKEIDYLKASKLMKEEKYEEARTEFIALKDYKDSKEKANKCRINMLKNPSVGSIVYFGKYEQDNNSDNGKEEIEWIVLAKKGKQYLVVSKYALDSQDVHNKQPANGITWEGCSLRKWLNGKFMDKAFSSDEKAKILTTTVTADKYSKGGRDAGNDTEDQVFLLSTKEVKKYFSKEEDRRCAPTPYAEEQGAYVDEDYPIDGKGACSWWLRTPGKQWPSGYSGAVVNATFYCVESDGSYGEDTDYKVYYDQPIRPALWINP